MPERIRYDDRRAQGMADEHRHAHARGGDGQLWQLQEFKDDLIALVGYGKVYGMVPR